MATKRSHTKSKKKKAKGKSSRAAPTKTASRIEAEHKLMKKVGKGGKKYLSELGVRRNLDNPPCKYCDHPFTAIAHTGPDGRRQFRCSNKSCGRKWTENPKKSGSKPQNGKRAKTNAERQQAFRNRQKARDAIAQKQKREKEAKAKK